jgi:hypothetical protein
MRARIAMPGGVRYSLPWVAARETCVAYEWSVVRDQWLAAYRSVQPSPEPDSTTTPPIVVQPPAVIVFTISAGHALVKNYRLDIYAAGANPSVAVPIATTDLGKPSPDTSGDATVDRAAFFAALKPGSYLATVTAVGIDGSLGEGHSQPVVLLR